MVNYEKIIKRIKKSTNVIVMGHKAIDFDSLGSCLAISELCDRLKKKCYIVLEDAKLEEGIKKGISYIEENNLKCRLVKYTEAKEKVKKETLLIIVDTYSDKRSQAPRLCNLVTNIIYIDHHLFGKPVDENYFINAKVSSACEILIQLFIKKRMRINKYTATIMLCGLKIDSNSFAIKTTEKTHECAAYLHHCGADLPISNSFTKTKLSEYIKIQKIIFKTEFYRKKYAIVVGSREEVYERKNLATIADTLMLFSNCEASFTIGYLGKKLVGVSARSNTLDVEAIMQKFGGGGSKTNAACEISGKTIKEVKQMLKGELK